MVGQIFGFDEGLSWLLSWIVTSTAVNGLGTLCVSRAGVIAPEINNKCMISYWFKIAQLSMSALVGSNFIHDSRMVRVVMVSTMPVFYPTRLVHSPVPSYKMLDASHTTAVINDHSSTIISKLCKLSLRLE